MSPPTIVMIYAQADESWAEWIAYFLNTERGYEIYRVWKPIPATNQYLVLDQAINNATHIVILFSPEFFTTQGAILGWGTVVVRTQNAQSGIVVPIRVQPCNPSGPLQPLVPIELSNMQEEKEARNKLFTDFDDIHARVYGAFQPSSPPQKPPFPLQRLTSAPEKTLWLARKSSPRFPGKPFSNIPYRRNTFFFTGREELLQQMIRVYETHKQGSPPVVVLCGLHGCGKTQIAIEYAYRHYESKSYQYILWIDANSIEKLEEEVGKLMEELSSSEERRSLPQGDKKDALALKQWLRTHERWLLVFDHIHNVSVIDDYIPPIGNGHVLLTTCTQHVSNAYPIHVGDMNENEAISFLLLRVRSNFLHNQISLEEQKLRDYECLRAIVQLLHRFPLALDQAGAYIASTNCGLKRYSERIKEQLIVYLKKRGVDEETPEYYHPATIVDDWKQAFHELEKHNFFAAELILVCTFFHPCATQEEIFIEGRTILWPLDQQVDDALSSIDNLIKGPKRYSFIHSSSEDGLLTIHPLMPPILLDDQSSGTQQIWPKLIFRVIKHICIDLQKELTYEYCQRWLPSIKKCLELIDKPGLHIPDSEKQQFLNLKQQMLDKLCPPDE